MTNRNEVTHYINAQGIACVKVWRCTHGYVFDGKLEDCPRKYLPHQYATK